MTTMTTGRLAEHLVCAELGRRFFIATTFTHNVPKFDVVVTDNHCRSVPIQVKATNTDSWRTDASVWMDIKLDNTTKTQIILGEKPLSTPDLIWICVAIKTVEQQEQHQRDEFFILTEREIQKILVNNYRGMLEKCEGHRKRNWKSLDCWWDTSDLAPFANNWGIIHDQLKLKAAVVP